MEDWRTGMGIDESAKGMSGAVLALDLLKETFPEGVLETSMPLGDAKAIVRPEFLAKVMEYLKNDPRQLFNVLIDITAVDYFNRNPRFDIVYQLLSLPFNRRLQIKICVPESEPNVASLTALWNNANWLEREVWDMFGIRFEGHPNLKRILLYEEFQGHPLRKDYPIRKRQPLIGPKN
jgi:NADH-quinone oxidoreductase subunit C